MAVTIPWNRDSAEIQLNAQCVITKCDLTAHQDYAAVLTYTLPEDAENAVLNGDTLTVTNAGTVKVTVKAEIPETGVASEKTAVITISKESAPKPVSPGPEDEQTPSTEGGSSTNLTPAPNPNASDSDPNTSAQTVKLTRPVLKVKKSGTKAKLSWKKNSKATGYIIQMKIGNGKYKKIAAKKKKVTSFTKKKLKKNTVYRFRIRSYKQIGSTKVYSAWSKAVKVRL